MKYKIILSPEQEEAIKIIKKSRKVIHFEDTNAVSIDKMVFIPLQMLRSFEMMELLVWKRQIGREQQQYALNVNQLNRVENFKTVE